MHKKMPHSRTLVFVYETSRLHQRLLCRLYVIKFNNLFDILSIATGTRARAYISELHNFVFFFRSNFNLHTNSITWLVWFVSRRVALVHLWKLGGKIGILNGKTPSLLPKYSQSFNSLYNLRLYEHVKKLSGKSTQPMNLKCEEFWNSFPCQSTKVSCHVDMFESLKTTNTHTHTLLQSPPPLAQRQRQ